MSKKIICLALGALLLALSFSVEAQQLAKVPRIGFLGGGSPSSEWPRIEALQQGLHQLGYIEGKNITIEYRFAEGDVGRYPDLAAELGALKVDLIVVGTRRGAQAAANVTKTIPIVFVGVSDPVRTKLVASLARPGGNLTGLSLLAPELSGKRLELLKEAVPGIARVAVLWNPTALGSSLKAMQAAAPSLGVQIQPLEVRSSTDFESALQAAAKERAGALALTPDPLFNSNRKRIVDLAAKNRLPAMYPDSAFVEAGGLMSYGPSVIDLYRRAATYIDKILKGIKPADLPVEQPMKFDFIINLKTATQIGVTIPPNVLARADKVIK